MADTYASQADLKLPSILAEEWDRILGDNGLGGAFHMHPVIAAGYRGSFTGQPSLSMKVPRIAWGGLQRLAARTEDNQGSPTALTDGSSTIVGAPQYFAYSQTQESAMTDIMNLLTDPTKLVQEAVAKYDARLFEMIAGLAAGFTGNAVNNSGVRMSIDDVFSAAALLDGSFAAGGFLLITNPANWASVEADLRKESGTVLANDPATLAQMSLLGSRYKGRIGGIDIITSSFLPASGGDTTSVVLGSGAALWADGLPKTNGANPFVDVAGKVLLEKSRTADYGRNNVHFHAVMGVIEGQDAAGASILSLT